MGINSIMFVLRLVSSRYDKTENLLHGGAKMSKFSHILLGVSVDNVQPYLKTHQRVQMIRGYESISIKMDFGRGSWKLFDIRFHPRVFLIRKMSDKELNEEKEKVARGL
jgi:hypothetical protein